MLDRWGVLKLAGSPQPHLPMRYTLVLVGMDPGCPASVRLRGMSAGIACRQWAPAAVGHASGARARGGSELWWDGRPLQTRLTGAQPIARFGNTYVVRRMNHWSLTTTELGFHSLFGVRVRKLSKFFEYLVSEQRSWARIKRQQLPIHSFLPQPPSPRRECRFQSTPPSQPANNFFRASSLPCLAAALNSVTAADRSHRRGPKGTFALQCSHFGLGRTCAAPPGAHTPSAPAAESSRPLVGRSLHKTHTTLQRHPHAPHPPCCLTKRAIAPDTCKCYEVPITSRIPAHPLPSQRGQKRRWKAVLSAKPPTLILSPSLDGALTPPPQRHLLKGSALESLPSDLLDCSLPRGPTSPLSLI